MPVRAVLLSFPFSEITVLQVRADEEQQTACHRPIVLGVLNAPLLSWGWQARAVNAKTKVC